MQMYFTVADLDTLDWYFGILLKKKNIGGKTRGRVFLLSHFFLFISYLVIKYHSADINLVFEILIIKLIKILGFWSNHMTHVDMSV